MKKPNTQPDNTPTPVSHATPDKLLLAPTPANPYGTWATTITTSHHIRTGNKTPNLKRNQPHNIIWPPQHLPQLLMDRRKQQSLTRRQAAQKLGVPLEVSIYQWERLAVSPNNNTTPKLEKLYGLPDGSLTNTKYYNAWKTTRNTIEHVTWPTLDNPDAWIKHGLTDATIGLTVSQLVSLLAAITNQ